MRYHVGRSGDVVACQAKPGHCPLAGDEGQAHGSKEEVLAAIEKQYDLFTVAKTNTLPPLNPGVKALKALIRARQDFETLARARRSAGGRVENLPENLRAAYEAKSAEIKDLTRAIRELPWDDTDGAPYDDSPLPFVKSPWRRGVRRGYENDLDKLRPEDFVAYEALDRASQAWIDRLSSAEVKALHNYVNDAQSYAESMAASGGQAATYTNAFRFLHSALEKAPRLEKPIVVYAGVSSHRVQEIREQAASGTVTMNRVQSTSLSPAMINAFMRPSSHDKEDHTALEIRTERIASLSLFQLREEMEILLPPQSYSVVSKERNVSYSYPDGYSYEPADLTLRLTPQSA